jgi:hypothetical protein
LLRSCIGGIMSSLSDKVCSNSLLFHLISLWQEA